MRVALSFLVLMLAPSTAPAAETLSFQTAYLSDAVNVTEAMVKTCTSRHPELTASQVVWILEHTARRLGGTPGVGRDPFTGLGLLDVTAAVQRNVKRIAELIATLEQRGAQVLLFEVPVPAQLEQSRSARITREIIHARFPDSDRWLRVVFPGSQFRWPDGLHLDERSAVIVAHSIDQALASLPGKK